MKRFAIDLLLILLIIAGVSLSIIECVAGGIADWLRVQVERLDP